MLIQIVNRFTSQGNEFYEWTLCDGPDGVEELHGYATDLITAFSKVIEWRERIAAEYAEEVVKDLETLKTFLANNETD
jgi:hypothetical protein